MTDVNLVFAITRPQNGQMPGINEEKRRKLAVRKDKGTLIKITSTLSIPFLAGFARTLKVLEFENQNSRP